MEPSGWLEVRQQLRVVWRFAGVRPGAQYVMMAGLMWMPVLVADNWATPDLVSIIFINHYAIKTFSTKHLS